jgi:teichuronic acid biosynthesis glycosyltransferase TuaC
MKRILILSTAYFPKFVGGAEIAIKEITDRIPESDISFDMVTPLYDSNLPRIEKIGNVTVYRIGLGRPAATIQDLKKFPLSLNKPLFQFLAAYKAGELHRKNHYDAIWAMMAHASGVPAFLFKWKNPGVKYILTLQEGDPIDYIKIKMLPIYPLFVQAFRKADVVQAISNFLGNWARDMGFKGNLEIIPNGVDTKRFGGEIAPAELESLKAMLNKKAGDVFLVTSSRLVKKNGLEDVIRSLQYLPENVSFLIIGSGPLETLLQKLVKELAVENRVKFLGAIDNKDLPKYLKVSDIFIRPSVSEGFGISFIEAFALGIPVVATQVGGISDFLFDPERNPDKKPTGRAVDVRNPRQIADAVQKYLSDKAATEVIVANGKALAKEKYDWDLVAQEMKQKVFDRVLA